MALRLEKGQRIGIGLNRVCVGLGWDPNEGSSKHPFDLDASAFMLDANRRTPKEDFVVFYNSERRVLPPHLLKLEPYDLSKYSSFDRTQFKDSEEYYRKMTRGVSPDWSVYGAIDDDTGSASDGDDDEVIDVDLTKVDPVIQEIIITATIYDCEIRNQNFGQVRNSYIRILNADSREEICKYDLAEDFSAETAIEFGRLYRRDGAWKFEAMGIGYKGGLQCLVNKYT